MRVVTPTDASWQLAHCALGDLQKIRDEQKAGTSAKITFNNPIITWELSQCVISKRDNRRAFKFRKKPTSSISSDLFQLKRKTGPRLAWRWRYG